MVENSEKERLTDLQSNNQLLYFTSTSLLKNENKLVFISDRTGHPNLFIKIFSTNEEKQLTFNTEGYLKSYVYFDGQENKGFGKASVSLDAETGKVYYLQGRDICSVDHHGKIKILNQLPVNQVTAFTHVSADGGKLCVPTTDARALDYDTLMNGRPDYDIDQRIREEKLASYIRIFDTETGEALHTEHVPECWITHVQFNPVNTSHILYNHEWPSDCGIRRIWLWDGKQHIQLRTENEQRSRNDWTCHEMWQKDGKSVIYHGFYSQQERAYIGKIRIKDRRTDEIPLPVDYKEYGHFTVGNLHNHLLVSGGYYHPEKEQPTGFPGGNWLSIQKVDWINNKLKWIPLCSHHSNWDSQDSHPHPIFDHTDEYVYFTSNYEGARAVYRTQVKV